MFYCMTQGLITSCYDTNHPHIRHAKRWRQLAGIEHTQTSAGTSSDIKEPPTPLHSRLNGRHKSLYLRQGLTDYLCNQRILFVDVLQQLPY